MKLNKNILLSSIIFIILAIFYYMGKALLPIFLSVILSYLLLPLCDKLENIFSSRKFSSLLSIMFLYLILILIIYVMFRFSLRFKNICSNISVEKFKINGQYFNELLEIWGIKQIYWKDLLNDNISNISNFFLDITKILVKSSSNLLNFASIFLITPIISYYILSDWYKINDNITDLLPIYYQETYLNLTNIVSFQMRNYLKTQFFTSIILSIIYSISLRLLKLDCSFYIGLIIGVMSFMPFIGQFTGLILSLIIGYSQYHSFDYLGKIIIIYLSIYVIESNFIIPKLIGDRLNLHPGLIIISCIIFGNLYGFVGILFSLPVTCFLLVITKFIIDKYKKSSLYL